MKVVVAIVGMLIALIGSPYIVKLTYPLNSAQQILG